MTCCRSQANEAFRRPDRRREIRAVARGQAELADRRAGAEILEGETGAIALMVEDLVDGGAIKPAEAKPQGNNG